ncbi:Quinone oxidoreductase 2 [compost metagenome]
MATEYAIRATRIPYTFLRNGGYTEFFINPVLQVHVNNGAIITNANKGKVNSVTRSDLALAAATVLTEDGHENMVYNLVSNQPWSFDDLAEILSEVSGKDVIHQSVSFEEEKNILIRSGMSEPLANTTAYIYKTIAEGTMEKTTDDLQHLIGFQTPIKELVIQALQ